MIPKRMTQEQYNAQPAEYRGIVDGKPYLLQSHPVTGGTTYGPVEIIGPQEAQARAMIASRTTYQLVADWEEIEKEFTTLAIFQVRGWLMDELERRNKPAFDSWLESNEASPRKFFVA